MIDVSALLFLFFLFLSPSSSSSSPSPSITTIITTIITITPPHTPPSPHHHHRNHPPSLPHVQARPSLLHLDTPEMTAIHTVLDYLRTRSLVDCDTLDVSIAEDLGPFVGCTTNQVSPSQRD